MERLGFIDIKGKNAKQIQKEVEARFGGLKELKSDSMGQKTWI